VNDAGALALRIVTVNSLLFFAALMLLSIFFLKSFGNHFTVTKSQYLLISASVNMIVALTLRWWLWIGNPPMFWLINLDLWKSALDIGPNWIFNFLLFVPAAYFLSNNLRKSSQVFIFLVSLSFGIETFQGIFGWGYSDPADWVANSIGTLLGIVLSSLPLSKRT